MLVCFEHKSLLSELIITLQILLSEMIITSKMLPGKKNKDFKMKV